MLRRYKNTAPPVLLQEEIMAGDTTLNVADTSNFPEKLPFIIAIERGTTSEEACLVTSKDAVNLFVERGFDGTTAQYHPGVDSSGFLASLVEHTTAAIDYRQAQIPWVTEADRDALDTGDEEDVWDGRMVYNADRRSVEVAHYDDIGSDESLGENFIEWAGVVPTGTVLPFSASDVPTGFLLCDGGEHLRSEYEGLAALYQADNFPFGNGDGSTTFNVPDLRQRFPIGVADSGTGDELGETGGAIDHSHTQPSHTHSGPNHSHSNPSTSTTGNHAHSQGNTGSAGAHKHSQGPTGATDGSHSHNYSAGTSSDNHAHNFSDSFQTGAASSNQSHTASGGFSTPNASHVHSGSVSGTTSSDNHAHNVSGSTSNTGAHGHGNPDTSNVSGHSHTTPNTNSNGSHDHNVGSTGNAGTGATGSGGNEATGTANPPFLALHFIVKT